MSQTLKINLHLITFPKIMLPITLLFTIMSSSWSAPHELNFTAMDGAAEVHSQITARDDKSQLQIPELYFRPEERQSDRTLQEDDTSYSIINPLGSVDITQYVSGRKFSNKPSTLPTSMYQVSTTEVWAIGSQSVLRVDVSDYTSPKVIDVVDVLLKDHGNDAIYDITPDGQYFVCRNTNTGGLYFAKVSQPGNYVSLNTVSNDAAQTTIFTYCAGNTQGYVFTKTTSTVYTLYKFDTSTGSTTIIQTISDFKVFGIIASNDCKSLFLLLTDSAGVYIRIHPDILSNPTSSYAYSISSKVYPRSFIATPDVKFIYLIYAETLRVYNVANPLSISYYSNTLQIKTISYNPIRLVLSPDGLNLMAALEGDIITIIDISTRTNPTQAFYTKSNPYQGYLFSSSDPDVCSHLVPPNSRLTISLRM